MLWQEPGIQALQVLNQDKRWIDAPPIPGTLVMKYVSQTRIYPNHGTNMYSLSIGDQFARWTSTLLVTPTGPPALNIDGPLDDVFKSTVHRAINRSSIERYSMPLFFGTDYDVKMVVGMSNVRLLIHAYDTDEAYPFMRLRG